MLYINIKTSIIALPNSGPEERKEIISYISLNNISLYLFKTREVTYLVISLIADLKGDCIHFFIFL